MFLRSTTRKKDGKIHRYWSVVENRRVKGGGVVQRHVLYLGEINETQRAAWCESFESLEGRSRSRAHRQADLCVAQREAPELSSATVGSSLRLCALSGPDSGARAGLGWRCGAAWNSTRSGENDCLARVRGQTGCTC